MSGHVVICGLGHIGFRAFELLRQAGKQVIVITDRAPDEWRRNVTDSGCTVLLGDARNDSLLLEARIQDASAVLAVTDQDLVNVSVVMDARRLNPTIRTVCRLFDTSLGAHLSGVLGVSQVLSASEIAAPVFVSAVLQRAAIARSAYRGVSLSIEECGQDSAPPAATVFAWGTPDGRVLAPGDSAEGDGPRLCLTQTPEPEANAGRSSSLVQEAFGWFLLPSLRKFRHAVLFILAVIVMAAAIVKLKMSLSWIDAFYFVTTTVTTVGYGDFNFSAAGPGLKLFGIVLMLLGTATLTLLFSTLADSFLSERFSSLFGGRNVPGRNHVIVAGAGHIGIRVVEHLANGGVPVVVIENDRVGQFAVDVKRRVAVVDGDARNADTLRRANAGTARAILAISDDDVENLSMSLSAQTLNPGIVAVVRIFDAELGSKLQSKLASRILSVSSVAAPYFAAAALADGIAAAVRWRDHLIVLSEKAGEGMALGSVGVGGTGTTLHVSAIRLR